ncbi:phosphodiesterase [Streptomyces sp. WAC05374]|uniref:metallophosphoesterase n=1 Tax=Streptomyces sp. WAC05374 TaxID=2487420 RepID=UPI000F8635F4|nr:metallophosphoesterase [Streptomyces sp. WAC05374]RST18252.1 phosphodiesterase [Streptomyces sp. WAC05374]TDF40419.1 phosphodiesterase [Streptomyces sp. WAC05374]TDF49053.1 phosphodiesterase [Streptomyces sp. WAC05374]TDF49538.1 phosphodiesterase [Streptomyces sp. WAC05374]
MLLAHISDLHLDGTERATERAARVVAYLNGLSRQPDAVLVTGDIADHGTPEQYAEAARLLAGLRAPALPCPGNHDDRAAYREVLLGEEGGEGGSGGTGPVNRLHRVAGHALLLMDSTIPGQDEGFLDDETLDWLTRTLDGLGGTPAVPAFHHPPALLHHPYVDSMNVTNADRLAEVLEGRTTVPAILTGHAHTPAASTFAGRPLLVAPGVVSTLRLPWEGGEGLTDRAAPPGVAFHVLDADGRVTTHFRVVP